MPSIPKSHTARKGKDQEKKEREKRYTCKECKEYYYMNPTKYAQKYPAFKWCCLNIDCMMASKTKFINKLNEEGEKTRRRIEKQKKDRLREEIKGITGWKDDLQKVVNWIVRELDKSRTCISHPEIKNFLRYDAGHYYPVSTCSDLRFNLHNIHKQSSEANQRYGGNANYTAGLINRYGSDYLNTIIELRKKYKGIGKEKFTIENIKKIYLPRARAIQREMKNGAIYTRDEINKRIGIYE